MSSCVSLSYEASKEVRTAHSNSNIVAENIGMKFNGQRPRSGNNFERSCYCNVFINPNDLETI